MEQIQEQIKICSGEILGIGYNTISVKRDDNKRTQVIHFDGLQKRVLRDIDEELLKRLKRIEWTDREDFWNIDINPIICCDDCKSGLFGLFDENTFFLDEKETCKNCGKWLCFDCINDKGLCKNCFKKQILDNL